jgi:hypothetical protein
MPRRERKNQRNNERWFWKKCSIREHPCVSAFIRVQKQALDPVRAKWRRRRDALHAYDGHLPMQNVEKIAPSRSSVV